MRRRDAARTLLGSLFASNLAPQDASATHRMPEKASFEPYPLTVSEQSSATKPTNLSFPPGNVLRWGADETGATDSTAAVQAALNVAWATGYFNSPWSGAGGATPIIVFPPGRYRISDSLVVPTGITVRGEAHPAHTTNHTRIIMDSGPGYDNRNKAIFRFNRATLNNAALMNSAMTSTIENLEFWFVTQNGTFDAPMAEGIRFGRYPDGAALLFDVDAADFRIINCVFQHSPAAIRIKDVGLPVAMRRDGWQGNRGAGISVDNCEFDAGCTHVYATASYLDIHFNSCQFFGAMHRYEGCTGKVVYESGRWHGSAYIDAASNKNDFERFTLKSADIEIGAGTGFLALDSSKLIDLSQNSVLGGSGQGDWVNVAGADGGCIVANAINNSGSRPPAAQASKQPTAAIKLRGCRNVLIATNNMTATDTGVYDGYGILTMHDRRKSTGNFVTGNAVSAPYGQHSDKPAQYIAVAAEDILGANHTP